MMYQAWQEDYGSKQPSVASTSTSDMPRAVSPSSDSDLESQTQHLLSSDSRIYVETDVLKLEIDTTGGDVRRVSLLKYPVDAKIPDNPFSLMNDELPNLFVAQSGLDNSPDLKVKLHWQNDKGISVSKIYTFLPGSYVIDVKYVVKNDSNQPWQGRLYGHFSGFGKFSFSIYLYGRCYFQPGTTLRKNFFR